MTTFKLKNDRLLEVNLQNEKVLSRAGAMVAYDGQIKFEKSITGGEGIFGMLKRKVMNEGVALMTASGTGTIYFADSAQEVWIIPLAGEKIFVESSSLLAYDTTLKTNAEFIGAKGGLSGLAASQTTGTGLFTTTVEGHGNMAVISRGNLIALEVSPNQPVFIDPDAYVAYKGNLTQEFIFDVNWKTFIGQSSGESYQLKYSGTGVVYIQPSERA